MIRPVFSGPKNSGGEHVGRAGEVRPLAAADELRATLYWFGAKVTVTELLNAESLSRASRAQTEKVAVVPGTSPQTGSVWTDGTRRCVVSPETTRGEHGAPDTW
jgi:hypothetical protein